MAYTCSECTYLKIDGDNNYGKYWCEKKGDWRYATDPECWLFCKAYSRSDSAIKNAKEYSEESQKGSGCLMTMILCHILSMPDDNIYLNTIRKFRNDDLQKTEDGLKLLIKYDVVGPKISNCLNKDTDKFNKSYILFSNYIVPIVNAINQNEKDKAIEIYTDMTENLIKYYGVDDKVDVDIKTIEPSLSGHGVLVKKTA